MESKIKTLTILVVFSLTSIANNISNYRVVHFCFNDSKEYALREFKDRNKEMILAVNGETLKTHIFEKDEIKISKCKESRYAKLLQKSSSAPYPLQNDGIVSSNKRAIIITTDLCPSSKKGFEKSLYLNLIKNFKNPVPVTLFITKRWIDRHPNEFQQFIKWDREHKLQITWGNHTAYHHYFPKAPLNKNFVLAPNENLKKDTLLLEETLLKRGVVPSVFFRFPGLVSDKKSVNIIKSLGLIIIGSNAWLAKGEIPKRGSIILVHGNKNEHIGVKILIKLIKDRKIRLIKSIYQI